MLLKWEYQKKQLGNNKLPKNRLSKFKKRVKINKAIIMLQRFKDCVTEILTHFLFTGGSAAEGQ